MLEASAVDIASLWLDHDGPREAACDHERHAGARAAEGIEKEAEGYGT
jgi:hypothetical protein